MTTLWAVGTTEDGCAFRAPFESRREAKRWAHEQKAVITRFLECHSNIIGWRQPRDTLTVEAAEL